MLYSLCRRIHKYPLIIETSGGTSWTAATTLLNCTRRKTRGKRGSDSRGENASPNRFRVALADNIMSQEYLLCSAEPQSPGAANVQPAQRALPAGRRGDPATGAGANINTPKRLRGTAVALHHKRHCQSVPAPPPPQAQMVINDGDKPARLTGDKT